MSWIFEIWHLCLTSGICWCPFIGKHAGQCGFREPDFPVCVWTAWIYLLRLELASEGEQGFPVQHCSAHHSPKADIADGSLCLRLFQHDLPSKNIQRGATWLLISSDDNISCDLLTEQTWSSDGCQWGAKDFAV